MTNEEQKLEEALTFVKDYAAKNGSAMYYSPTPFHWAAKIVAAYAESLQPELARLRAQLLLDEPEYNH